MVELPDGTVTEDPRLDRLREFDERSRAFPIRAMLSPSQTKPRSYSWRVDTWLDQGQEGACVGFAWTHEAAARPVIVPNLTNADARAVYLRAQQLDQWPGEAYSGTSVLAGAKASQEAVRLLEYRWGFGLEDAVLAIGYKGPGVFGLDWHNGMFRPDADGFLNDTGGVAGGHAILGHRVKIVWLLGSAKLSFSDVDLELSWVGLHNSWDRDWGIDGRAKLRLSTLGRLLAAGGEFCIPTKRRA